MKANVSIEEKTRLKESVKKCLDIVNNYEEKTGLDLSQMREKLMKALDNIEDEHLKIALFGGFSDGKSTIIAALTGDLSIEIAPEPSTDRIKYYKFNDLHIVDTPGLFSENIPHDEETRKFISEADLILFVTEAVNPLKESQHEVIRWLLKDLGKLPQTVFVINKMDTVSDLYSDEDFTRMCEVKRKAVVESLNKIIGEFRDDYIVLCVSADPWVMGLNHWLRNPEEYRKLSRIDQIEKVLRRIIEDKGRELKQKTVESILRDVSILGSEEFRNAVNDLKGRLEKVENEYSEYVENMNQILEEIDKASGRVKKRLKSLREEIMEEILKCSDSKCLEEVYVKRIGRGGIILKTEIESIIRQEFSAAQDYLSDLGDLLKNIYKDLEEVSSIDMKLIDILNHASLISVLNISQQFSVKIDVKKIIEIILKLLEIVTALWKYFKFKKEKEKIIEDIDRIFSEFLVKSNFETKIRENVRENFEEVRNHLKTQINGYQKSMKTYREAIKIFEECRKVLKV